MGETRPDAAAAPPAPLPALTDLPLMGYRAAVEGLPGAKPFHGDQLRRWVLERGATSFDAMTDLPKALREELSRRYRIRSTSVVKDAESDDGTRKFLLELRDGHTIESVLIPEGDRDTLCMSSQVGCGVRCAFCASGMAGVVRNLTSGEMVEQVLVARERLGERGRRLTNVVVMGGGEPLNNFEALKTALEVVNAKQGLEFGARRVTVSTIGIPSKIDRLEELGRQVNLAVSLHAPDEALRGQLIPGLDRVPLADVLAAARRFFDRTGREVTFEYVVLGGVNDTPECTAKLARLLRDARGKVNLIPWNPVQDLPFRKPEPGSVEAMRAGLERAGVKVTVRRPRGRDIDAACGQLRRRYPKGDALAREAGNAPAREANDGKSTPR